MNPPASSSAGTASGPVNQALSPVAPGDRVFSWHDHASLWFSLGVGLLVMQVGAYLMPALSPREALLAIVAGSLVGAGLLGWVAKLGCDSGLSSAGLMHAVYGRRSSWWSCATRPWQLHASPAAQGHSWAVAGCLLSLIHI